MRFHLKRLSSVDFLKRKWVSAKTTLRNEALRILRCLQDRRRLVTTGIHLPLYVASAICLIPLVYSETGDGQEQLRVAKGWRRIIAFVIQIMFTVRVVCIYCLCLNENFRWTFGEYFTGDAVAFCVTSIMCSYPLISIYGVHFFGEELCQLYNATRRLTDRFAGKNAIT